MRFSLKLVIVIIIFTGSFSTVAFAHAGKTDELGGHYDNATGEYHYHHGYSAHKHINGICPYNHDDQTNHSSNNSKSDVTAKPERHLETPDPHEPIILQEKENEDEAPKDYSIPNLCNSIFLDITEAFAKNIFEGIFVTISTIVGGLFILYFAFCLIFIIAQLIFQSAIYTVKEIYKRLAAFKTKKYRNIHSRITDITTNYITCIGIFRTLTHHVHALPESVYIEGNQLKFANTDCDETYYISVSGYAYHRTKGCSTATIPVNLSKDANIFLNRTPCSKCANLNKGYCLPYEFTRSFKTINGINCICKAAENIKSKLNDFNVSLYPFKKQFFKSESEYTMFKKLIENEINSISESIKMLEKEYFGKISSCSMFAAKNVNKPTLSMVVIDKDTKDVKIIKYPRSKLPKNFMDYVGTDGMIYAKRKAIDDEENYIIITCEEFKSIKEKVK